MKKYSVLVLIVLFLSLLTKSQDTCASLNDIASLKLQLQVMEQNTKAQVEINNNQTLNQLASDKLEMKDYIDNKTTEKTQQLRNDLIAQTAPYKYSLSLLVAFGMSFSLVMLAFYLKKLPNTS